jgi:hypothetical protein
MYLTTKFVLFSGLIAKGNKMNIKVIKEEADEFKTRMWFFIEESPWISVNQEEALRECVNELLDELDHLETIWSKG